MALPAEPLPAPREEAGFGWPQRTYQSSGAPAPPPAPTSSSLSQGVSHSSADAQEPTRILSDQDPSSSPYTSLDSVSNGGLGLPLGIAEGGGRLGHNSTEPPNSTRQSHSGRPDQSNSQRDASKNQLQVQLEDACIEWPPGGTQDFIPVDAQKRIMTTMSIAAELGCHENRLGIHKRIMLARTILRRAPKLFAILVYIGLGQLISEFLDEGIGDKDLPFERSDRNDRHGQYKLCSKKTPSQPIRCMVNWSRSRVKDFDRDQWVLQAPIFEYKDDIYHYDLHDSCVLPFIVDNERSGVADVGGFSRVWEIIIHPAHQKLYKGTNLESQNPPIALKQLHSTNEGDFNTEVKMLKAFTPHRHRNLIRLLCTYRYKGRYFLMFPYAKSNLRKYWQDNPRPDFSKPTLLWSLNQCKAICSGLYTIHEHRTTQESADLQRARSEHSNVVDVEESDRLYGRHGDIKPENILLSLEEAEKSRLFKSRGVLLIADFGLMDLHRRHTRSLVMPDRLGGSPTYEPPDLKLHEKISRAYDVWSLGCVFLEFITWLVYGWEKLDQFPQARGLDDIHGFNDDTFYTTIQSKDQSVPLQAIVRESVQAWIKWIHQEPKSSTFIHEFLNLVLQEMLVVKPSDRIRCGPLNDRLNGMLRKAHKDPNYLTRGVPCGPGCRIPLKNRSEHFRFHNYEPLGNGLVRRSTAK